MHSLKIFILISWISLPTVMFGGYSFLTFLRGKLTPKQATMFRAGHAHAGVLLILSLVYYYYMSLTTLPVPIQFAACGMFATGIILQSGGFFWQAFLDKEGAKPIGAFITTAGAILLASGIAVLAWGIAITL